jgi:phosphatidylserine/phosphatidylglycerophosphate/cardiolipin synthase-like enzyme
MTTASFNQIKQKILTNIDQSKRTIQVSVAWLTSKDLLGQLIDKLDTGCKVELIISDHLENRRLSFDTFLNKGGQVFILQTKSGRFLHDKFAIFDNVKLIAGSYNWTNSAEFYNHEFIIQSSDEQLIKQFGIRFENLKRIVTNYDKTILIRNNELTAETKEDDFINLENELEAEFFETLKEANLLGAKINSTNVISYIHNYGAIGGASRLINQGIDKLHSGLLKLWEIKRLDISFENIILKDKYKILFDKQTLENAEKRLKELM